MPLHLLRGRACSGAAAAAAAKNAATAAEAARRRCEAVSAELALHICDLLLEIALGRLLELGLA